MHTLQGIIKFDIVSVLNYILIIYKILIFFSDVFTPASKLFKNLEYTLEVYIKLIVNFEVSPGY